jgi:5-methylcytosine-specific restriction endonuclease McrA
MRECKRNTNFVFLPCLRCGKPSVVVLVPKPVRLLERPDLYCINDECGARHFLSVQPDRVVYDRDTRRYPSENYDDNDFPVIKLEKVKRSPQASDGDSILDGPIIILRRKSWFSLSEFCTIFKNSNGKCHICKKRWVFSAHGVKGWHVDHVIPHAGGGHDTEEIQNFRVACARCNLKKGRGYTRKTVEFALKQLWV